MLGSALVHHFARQLEFTVTATNRQNRLSPAVVEIYPTVRWKNLDTETATVADLVAMIANHDWVINAVGLIKQKIHPGSLRDWEKALRVNSLFSVLLAQAAEQVGATVLQITTDCVFNGNRGRYTESDVHDAFDVYGKSKSLGEVASPSIRHLRCSIVGPERETNFSLLNWFLSHPHGDAVCGFANHHWNGITSYHFARICEGIIRSNIELPLHQHVVPADEVSKFELLNQFAHHFHRQDIQIRRVDADEPVNRTLATMNTSLNEQIWRAAGYARPPTVDTMICELSQRGNRSISY